VSSKKTAFAYIGVSSDRRVSQADIDSEKNLISDSAAQHGLEIVEWFEENGALGGAVFRDMVKRLKTVDAVITGNYHGDFKVGSELVVRVRDAKKIIGMAVPGVPWNDLDAVLDVYVDDRQKFNKSEMHEKQLIGIKDYIARNQRWGRHKKRIEWKQYKKYKDMGLPMTNIAKLLSVHVVTLKRRVKEREAGRETDDDANLEGEIS